MSCGKRIRTGYFCKTVLHETQLSLNLKNYVKFEKQILCPLLLNYCPLVGYLYFYFIMKKPIDKHQDAEIIC